MTHWTRDRTWQDDHIREELVDVPEHKTARLTIDGNAGFGSRDYAGSNWIFTFTRDGCLRVQRGDFCAYIPPEALGPLVQFIEKHRDRRH
jgi:hypothetical protein